MKLVFIILLFLSLGCSNHMEDENSKDINIFISSDHKILSNPELIREKFLNLLNDQELDFNLLTMSSIKTLGCMLFKVKKDGLIVMISMLKNINPLLSGVKKTI